MHIQYIMVYTCSLQPGRCSMLHSCLDTSHLFAGFWVLGLGFTVKDLGFKDLGFKVYNLRFDTTS